MSPSFADQRRARRARVSVEVTVIGRGCGPRHGLIRDISSRGAYVVLSDGAGGLRTGAAITLRFHVRQSNISFSRQLGGRVVRADGHGVALEFSEGGLVADAVVEDLRFYAGRCKALQIRVGGP
ncbi:MAG: PilZ domain-containing protein [Gammaproteobacteria bacterium]